MELLKKKNLGPGSQTEGPNDAEQADLETENSGTPEEAAAAEQEVEPAGAQLDGEVAPQEELLNAYRSLEVRIAAMEAEAANYRRMIERTGLDAQLLRKKSDDEAFLQSIRSKYEADPVSAVNKLVERAQAEIWQAVEGRIERAFKDHREFKMGLQQFLDDPKNGGLKGHERLVEHLIRDKGVPPEQVAGIVKQIEADITRKSRLRAAAAKTIRNQAAVETGGEMGEPVDKDKELDRVIKKAKTLDDLFAGLRGVKI